jgi:hypothetical protein
MTLHCSYYRHHGRTPFGVFHNLNVPSEETGYLFLHVFGRAIGVTWGRHSAK